ncbi:MAG: DUF2214 family protein [Candidatus Sericytochromatia bacterium]
MLLSALLSTLHLLTLALGLGAIVARIGLFRALAQAPDNPALRSRLLQADNLWGLAALFWIGTGLYRLLGGLEKPLAFYLGSGAFWLKMGLFLTVFALELAPMLFLMRWRQAGAEGLTPEPARLLRYARSSQVQAGVVILIVCVAAAMARGLGAGLLTRP